MLDRLLHDLPERLALHPDRNRELLLFEGVGALVQLLGLLVLAEELQRLGHAVDRRRLVGLFGADAAEQLQRLLEAVVLEQRRGQVVLEDDRVLDQAPALLELLEGARRVARLEQRRAQEEADLGVLPGLLHQLLGLHAGRVRVALLQRIPSSIDPLDDLLREGRPVLRLVASFAHEFSFHDQPRV